MPSLEDTPSLVTKADPAGSDLIPLFDASEVGNSRIKKSTLLRALTSVAAALPGPFADDAAAASGGVAVGELYLNNSLATGAVTVRLA